MGHIIVHQKFADSKSSVPITNSLSRDDLTEDSLDALRHKQKHMGLLQWAIEWPGVCLVAHSKGWLLS